MCKAQKESCQTIFCWTRTRSINSVRNVRLRQVELIIWGWQTPWTVVQKSGATAKVLAEIFKAQNIERFRCSDSSVSFAFRLNLTAITQMISFKPSAAHYQRCFAQTCPWQLYLWSVTTNVQAEHALCWNPFRPKLQFVIKMFQYFSLKS